MIGTAVSSRATPDDHMIFGIITALSDNPRIFP
jgi:hypothetical protein